MDSTRPPLLSRRHLLASSALLLSQAPQIAPALADTTPHANPEQPIVLSWNENPYGPSPATRAALREGIASACRYADDEMGPLRDLIAHAEGVGADRIVIGTGSGELLRALALICARERGELIAAQPTYTEITDYASSNGARVRFVPVDGDLRHDLTAMRAAVSPRTRMVYVCNPNNPTGTVVPARAIAQFVESLPPEVTTIVDEAYLDFVDDPAVHSAAALVGGPHRVVVLRTFSKIHGKAGVRCGYAIAPPVLATAIAGACMTYPNVFAMRGARASLGDRAFRAECRRRILASRARITRELDRLGMRCATPQGNFVFFDTGVPLERFAQFMRARNILVGRPFPPYDSWCRVTIGTETEVHAFLGALAEFRATRSRAA